MNNEIKTWLYDILQSINEIDSYYKDKPKVFEEYISDTGIMKGLDQPIQYGLKNNDVSEKFFRIVKEELLNASLELNNKDFPSGSVGQNKFRDIVLRSWEKFQKDNLAL